MRLDAIQVFQPQGTALTLRGTAARLGRLALLYMAVASIGATLALFSFLLTWRNLSFALAGLVVGLALVHHSTIFIEVLIFLARHFKRDLRSLSTLSHELRSSWVARDLNGAVGAELRLLVRSVAILLSGAIFFALTHESLTLRWSSLTGFYIGAALVVIGRFIFHLDTLDIHHHDDTDASIDPLPQVLPIQMSTVLASTIIEERVVAAAILGELIPELQYAAPLLLERLDRRAALIHWTSPSDLGFESGTIDAQMLELFRQLAPSVRAALGHGLLGILQSWVLHGRSKKSQDELLTALSQLRAQNAELRQVLESIARGLSVTGHAPVPQSEIDEAIAAAIARLAQSEL